MVVFDVGRRAYNHPRDEDNTFPFCFVPSSRRTRLAASSQVHFVGGVSALATPSPRCLHAFLLLLQLQRTATHARVSLCGPPAITPCKIPPSIK
ncbi:hypothetical protein ACLOJK_010355 [Asimina triloba]